MGKMIMMICYSILGEFSSCQQASQKTSNFANYSNTPYNKEKQDEMYLECAIVKSQIDAQSSMLESRLCDRFTFQFSSKYVQILFSDNTQMTSRDLSFF
jgi:hypothetical protein